MEAEGGNNIGSNSVGSVRILQTLAVDLRGWTHAFRRVGCGLVGEVVQGI